MTRPSAKNPDIAKADLKQLWQLKALLAPYRRQILIAAMALLVAAGSFLLMGQGLRAVIDQGLATRDAASLNTAMVFFLGVIFVLSLATYVRFYYVSWLGERVIADLRKMVFSHLLTLAPDFYEQTRTGEIVSRLTNDTTMLETVIGSSLSMALRNFLLLIGGLVMLFVTSLKLSLFVLIGVPLVVGPILIFGRKVRALSRASQDRLGDVSAVLDETLHEMRTVQAYVHETHAAAQFNSSVEAVMDTAKRRIRSRAALIVTVILLAFGAIGFILWSGGHDVINGKISPGQLSAFVFYAVIVASAAGTISEVIGDLQRAAGATERLQELLQTTATIAAPAQPSALAQPTRGDIEFSALDFHYPTRPDAKALAQFNLKIQRGEKLALVGPSGAGKSTLFQLLLRFYDAQTGSISIDGVDLRQLSPQQVRSQIALVAQDPVIFDASIRDNVRYAKPDADDSAVSAACTAAYANEFVDKMPEGLGTMLGERGVRLSGGQKQRLAIARAILADRPILLLDEATSALDAESERMVQMALEKLMQNRTTLIIAHRLATVKNADRIAVLENGQLIGVGTHDELVQGNALYARLAALQFNV